MNLLGHFIRNRGTMSGKIKGEDIRKTGRDKVRKVDMLT